MTFRISTNTNATDSISVSILPYSRSRNLKVRKEMTSRARDLASDCDVTISVTCCISSNANDTRSILVSILPYLKLGKSKLMKFIYNSRVTWKITDVTISVTYFISSDKCDIETNLGIGVTIFEDEELENNKKNSCRTYLRELDSDVLISVTCFIRSRKSRGHFYAICMSSVDNFLIFVFLGLESDEIDTKIVFSCVISIEEILKHGHGNRDITVTC